MFPGEKITKIEKDSRKYEVELTNDVELNSTENSISVRLTEDEIFTRI